MKKEITEKFVFTIARVLGVDRVLNALVLRESIIEKQVPRSICLLTSATALGGDPKKVEAAALALKESGESCSQLDLWPLAGIVSSYRGPIFRKKITQDKDIESINQALTNPKLFQLDNDIHYTGIHCLATYPENNAQSPEKPRIPHSFAIIPFNAMGIITRAIDRIARAIARRTTAQVDPDNHSYAIVDCAMRGTHTPALRVATTRETIRHILSYSDEESTIALLATGKKKR